MATAEELLAVVGAPVDSAAVNALVAVDGLASSTGPDYEEGEPRRSYLTNLAAGYQLLCHSGRVVTAFLYAEPAEGFAAFPGSLPGGLARGTRRAEVLARFGAPERSGEAVTVPGLGRQGAWDRFAVDAVRVHFQYTEPEQSIRLVSVIAEPHAP